MLKRFKDLSEKEILAIAIAAEEEDGRIYGEFADALREEYPSTAQMFEEMREEEVGHRDRLFAMFRQRFGDHIPLIRRENVKGFLTRKPVWLVRPLGVKVARRQAGKRFWWGWRLRLAPAFRWLFRKGFPTTAH